VKVGVIGCGYWGPNLIRNLFASGRCESVYCFDTAPKLMRKMLGQFPSLAPTTSIDDPLQCCDAIMIATPVKSHYPIARQALDAGKSVFVEKPLTASFSEGAELVELAERKQVALMTGHTFLYSPAVRKIRQYFLDGTLGETFSISSSRVNLGIHRQDVNVIWDLAPHDLSMLICWLQESPSRVAAVGRACVGHNIDVASLHLQFPSGAIANLEVSWLAPNKLRRTVIVGSRKMVVYDDTSANEKIKLYDSSATMLHTPSSFGEYQLTYRNGDLLSPSLESGEPLLAQTHALLDWVEHKVEPENNVWIALQVVATIEAACRSLLENGRLVDIRGMKIAAHSGLKLIAMRPVVAGD
jgi:predicted dehydrogenase